VSLLDGSIPQPVLGSQPTPPRVMEGTVSQLDVAVPDGRSQLEILKFPRVTHIHSRFQVSDKATSVP